MRLAVGLATAVAATVVAAGCAPLGVNPAPPPRAATARPPRAPHAGTRSRASTRPARPATVAAAVAIAQATHEYPSRPVTQSVADPAAGPVAAVQAFARAYINWSSTTVSADMRALAARSLGQARSAVELAAAQTAEDYELARGGVANAGTVEAVAPLPGIADRYVVVTLERTTATNTDTYEGLVPAWHVAVATVTEVGGGRWAVSGWQPES